LEPELNLLNVALDILSVVLNVIVLVVVDFISIISSDINDPYPSA